MLIDKNIVLKLTHSAIENAKVAVEMIKNAVFKDEQIRKAGGDLGLIHSMKRLDSIMNNERNPQDITYDEEDGENDENETESIMDESSTPLQAKVTDQGNGVVELNPNAGEEVVAIKEISGEQKRKEKIIEIDLPENGSDSEEESVQTLTGQDLQEGRQWYKQSWKK